MNYLCIMPAALLALMLAAPAMAGEGQGEPFSNSAVRPITAQLVLNDTSNERAPVFGRTIAAVQPGSFQNGGVLEPSSSEASVEIVASYPAHALDGADSSRAAAAASRYFAAQATTTYATALQLSAQ